MTILHPSTLTYMSKRHLHHLIDTLTDAQAGEIAAHMHDLIASVSNPSFASLYVQARDARLARGIREGFASGLARIVRERIG